MNTVHSTDSHVDVYFLMKGASDKEKFEIDFSDRIAASDTISTVAWTIASGITSSDPTNDTKSVYIWLRNGTSGASYKVSAQITTTAGELKTDWFYVTVM